LPGAWVINRLQCVERSIGKSRPCADDPAQENDAILVGNSGYGVDDFHRRRVAQQSGERGLCFSPSDAPEGTEGRNAYLAVAIVGQTEKDGDDRWPWACAATGISAHIWIGVLKEREDCLGGQRRLEVCGDADGDFLRRSLHNVPGD
jgi:hypothetical protein